jgi:hypothetical protein
MGVKRSATAKYGKSGYTTVVHNTPNDKKRPQTYNYTAPSHINYSAKHQQVQLQQLRRCDKKLKKHSELFYTFCGK